MRLRVGLNSDFSRAKPNPFHVSFSCRRCMVIAYISRLEKLSLELQRMKIELIYDFAHMMAADKIKRCFRRHLKRKCERASAILSRSLKFMIAVWKLRRRKNSANIIMGFIGIVAKVRVVGVMDMRYKVKKFRQKVMLIQKQVYRRSTCCICCCLTLLLKFL